MENFIYSLNATVPIFIVILVGWILKQRGMLNDEFVTIANKFNYKITLPALLFKDISTANIREDFDIRYVAFCMIVTSICFFLIWGITELIMKDQSMVGAFVQASFRGSAAVLGVAFIQNMYGTSGMAPLMIVGTVPLYNIYSVIVLTFKSNGTGGKNMKTAIINICKNPIILSILLGLIVSLLDLSFGTLVDKSINNFAVMATPLALVAIGAGFEGKKAIAKINPTIIAALIKLILQPAIFLPIAVLLGFRDQKLVALLIMLGSPTTVSCYIMAKNMDNDGVLSSSIIVVTTLLSSITLTFWIYLLRNFSMI